MGYSRFVMVGVLAGITAGSAGLVTVGLWAQEPAATKPGTGLRTPWGEPDLQGIWSGETLTPMQRPARFADKPVLSKAEEAAIVADINKRPGRDGRAERGTEKDIAGAYNQVYSGRAITELSDGRTALVIDPPIGRVPPTTEQAKKLQAEGRAYSVALDKGTLRNPGPFSPRRNEPPPRYNSSDRLNRADGPEDRGLGERCLSGNLPNLGAVYRVVQSPGQVAIYHDSGQGQGFSRVIPVDNSKHFPSSLRFWRGDARGHWEGDTLVVDITNFTHKSDYMGSRENLHLVERFKRAGPDRLEYTLTVEDPTTWTQPWTLMVPWKKQSEKADQVYESNCHEGNYGMIGMLSGARVAEQRFKAGKGPDPRTMDLSIFSGDLEPGTGCTGGGIERLGDK